MLALLNDEQQMLKDVAARIAGAASATNPGDLTDGRGPEAWTALGRAGLLGLRQRDSMGFPGGSGVDVAVVAEALGGGLVAVPFVGSAVLATELLALAAAEEAVGDLAAGDRMGVLLTGDLSGLARLPGDGHAVAFDADGAANALALVERGDAVQVVRVPIGTGFTSPNGADLTRTLLRQDGPVDMGRLIPMGRPPTRDDLARWEALALVAFCADTVGVLRSAVARAVDYAKERVQYGVPIGSFQAVQHLCAEAYVSAEAAASATNYAAWAVDALEPAEALLAARTAKVWCGQVARPVTETVMQVFGGIGQTYEHIAHVYTRRALLDRVALGDEGSQLLQIADARLGGE